MGPQHFSRPFWEPWCWASPACFWLSPIPARTCRKFRAIPFRRISRWSMASRTAPTCKLNGVKIGSVSGLHLDHRSGPQRVSRLKPSQMSNEPDVQAAERYDGDDRFGKPVGRGKYMSLEPGIEDDAIKTDGTGRKVTPHRRRRCVIDDLCDQVSLSTARSAWRNATGRRLIRQQRAKQHQRQCVRLQQHLPSWRPSTPAE